MAAEECYTSSGVAGIVVATIVVTLIVVGLALALLVYFRRRRNSARRLGDIKEDVPLGDPSGSDCKYAFDNPYFKEDDGEKTLDAAEKGHASVAAKNSTAPSSPQSMKSQCLPQATQQNAMAAGNKNKKRKVSISHPFAVFHPVKKQQQRAMDDSCLAMEPERMVVPLRGHDFTGLGFNVCGNMRDGIFVKDVLHRGPASESGKVKAGDRIVSVTVSFTNMVYEDALTILSYASPYDVQLEIEKATEKSHAVTATMGPSGKRLGSSSFSGGGQRLFHPLYRSQSIDDLTQIGKDPFTTATQRASPKRSQSIGLSSSPALEKGNRSLSVLSSPCRNQQEPSNLAGEEPAERTAPSIKTISVATGSLNERVLTNAIGEDAKKLKLEVQKEPATTGDCSSPLQLTTNSLQGKNKGESQHMLTADKLKMDLSPNNKSKMNDEKERKLSLQETRGSDMEQKADEKSQSFPRKNAAPGKRRAPPPPTTGTGSSGISLMKTTAQVHQSERQQGSKSEAPKPEDEINSKTGEEEMESVVSSDLDKDSIGCPPGSELLESVELDSLDQSSLLNHPGSRLLEDTVNTDSGSSNDSFTCDTANQKMKAAPNNANSASNNNNNNVQRKSASLVDLTKMAEGSAPKSSAHLERAVSMDFKQQPLPEGNLGQQKKMLHQPNFGSETISEDYESAVSTMDEEIGVITTKLPKTNLTKWNSYGVWDQAISHLQNGEDSSSAIGEHSVTGTMPASPSAGINHSTSECNTPTDKEMASAIDEALLSNEEATSLSLPNISNSCITSEEESKTLTSTPGRRIIKSEDFLKSDLMTNGRSKGNEVGAITDDTGDGARKTEMSDTSCSSSGSANKNESTIINSPFFVHNNISIDIPVIPPIVDRHSPLSNPLRSSSSTVFAPNKDGNNGSNPSKEVIEISEHELDDVMMSHRQFLLKQAKMTGVYSNLNPDVNRQSTSEIDFESWSYDDGTSYPSHQDGASEVMNTQQQHPSADSLSSVNGSGSEASSTSYYRTALEINDLSATTSSTCKLDASSSPASSSTTAKMKQVMPEISGYTVRTSEGGITKTIIISSPEAASAAPSGKAVPMADSPPPRLEPPQ